ncbi:MAG: WG repeat-containing protein [Cyclobacteriaceae bacterium]
MVFEKIPCPFTSGLSYLFDLVLFTLRRILRTDFTKVSRLVFISVIFFFLSSHVNAQNLKRISKHFEKGEFDKAKEQIRKGLDKDSTSFGVHFFDACYYLNNELSQYNLDSARISINTALYFLEEHSQEQEENWAKTERPIDHIDSLKTEIINLTFARELDFLSVNSMNKFMGLFPVSHLNDSAIFLRDSMAYELALDEDSWQAYEDYGKNYPESVFAKRARDNYEILIYKDKTRDGSLESYQGFLRDFPSTPYRRESEEVIFQKMTSSHRKEHYQKFLSQYPNSHLKKKCADILYYLHKTDSSIRLSDLLLVHPNPDSLIKISNLESLSLTPILYDGGFSVMDTTGEVFSHLKYSQLDGALNCGNVNSEWLRVKTEDSWIAVNRNGDELIKGVLAIKEVGNELLFVQAIDRSYIFHKSGFSITSFEITDARIIFDRWIAFQKASNWGIMSFTGEVILQPKWDNIFQKGSFAILEDQKKFDLLNVDILEKSQSEQQFSMPYSDFEVLGDTLFLGFEGDKEALVDRNLDVLIPLQDHRIYLSKPLWHTKSNDLFYVYEKENKKLSDEGFSNLIINDTWIAKANEGDWTIKGLQDSISSLLLPLDSVYFISDSFAYTLKEDSAHLFFKNGERHFLESSVDCKLLSNPNDKAASSFALISDKTAKTILNESGDVVFEGKMDDIRYLNDSLIIVKTKEKYGIYHLGNRFYQRATYDLISEENGLALILKNGKIGCLDLTNGIIIPAVYQSKIERFSEYYLVRKNNLKGVVNAESKIVVPIEYDELLIWNDSTYWAQKDQLWSLLTFSGEAILKDITELKKWSGSPQSDLYVFVQEEKRGIVHPERGIIIPPAYNDIINIGTADNPIFFAEEHLRTAEFYVVTYFNAFGKTIKSQAYRTDEYEMIYCDQ